MKVGKLPNDVLEKLVLSNITNKRDEVITRAAVGEDCAVIDFGEYACVLSTDPITGASENIGKLAVHISCNDVASNGAEPLGILMTIMAPEDTTEKEIEKIMKDAGVVARELNVEIIGGHTEITNAVNKIVISTTVIGRQLKDKVLNTNDVRIGDKVIITKMAGIEGTSIIAHELEEKLKTYLTIEELQEGKCFINDISVVKEGKICGEIGVKYMHDITEGGILGAIWEASQGLGKGIEINETAIPIAKSTEKICKFFSIDPLRLISSGSMLIIASEEKANEVIKKLKFEGIKATIIGEVVERGVSLNEDGKVKDVDPPESDELYKVL